MRSAEVPAAHTLLAQQSTHIPQPDSLRSLAQGDALSARVHHVTLLDLRVITGQGKTFIRAGRHRALDLDGDFRAVAFLQQQVNFGADLGSVKIWHPSTARSIITDPTGTMLGLWKTKT